MKLLTELLSTDYGMMSLGVIVFILGMGVFFVRMFLKNLKAEEHT